MFYISSICHVGIGNSINKLRATHTSTKYIVSGGSTYCNIDDLSKIQVGVYDTDDKTEEFYFIYDLLNLLTITDVKIEGLEIAYFSRGVKVPNNLDSIKYLNINLALASTSNEFRGSVAKLKLVSGVDIGTDGRLDLDLSEDGYRVLNEVFRKGDTIVFPDVLRYLTLRYNYHNKPFLDAKKISISCDYDFSNYNSRWGLRVLINSLAGEQKEKFLIVNGDFRVNLRLFKELGVNIYSRGTINVSGFKNSFNRIKQDISNKGTISNRTISNYELSRVINKVFYIADSNYIYKVDFKKFSIEKEKNDGRLVL